MSAPGPGSGGIPAAAPTIAPSSAVVGGGKGDGDSGDSARVAVVGGKRFRKRVREVDDEEGGAGAVNGDGRAAAVGAPVTSRGDAESGDAGLTAAPPAKRATMESQRGGAEGDGAAGPPAPPSALAAVAAIGAVESTRSAAPHVYGGGAFAENEADTRKDVDGRALLEKRLLLQNTSAEAWAQGDKSYRGMAGYGSFVTKDVSSTLVTAKAAGTHGPQRAPTNIRGTVRIDYAPDVCKDYKMTGYCARGDTCIFLHDRSDYKMGWQLDREWDAEQKRKEAALKARTAAHGGGGGEPDEAGDGGGGRYTAREALADDSLPFACAICVKPFTHPIQTPCGHYFCERCAMARYATDPTCAVCGRQTNGIFNAAPKLLAKLQVLRPAEYGAGAPPSGEDGVAGGGGWSTVET